MTSEPPEDAAWRTAVTDSPRFVGVAGRSGGPVGDLSGKSGCHTAVFAGAGIDSGAESNTLPPETEFRTVEARKKPPRSEAACGGRALEPAAGKVNRSQESVLGGKTGRWASRCRAARMVGAVACRVVSG